MPVLIEQPGARRPQYRCVDRDFRIREVDPGDAPVAIEQRDNDQKREWRLWDGKLWACKHGFDDRVWPSVALPALDEHGLRARVTEHPLALTNKLLHAMCTYEVSLRSDPLGRGAKPFEPVFEWTRRRCDSVISIGGFLWFRHEGPVLEFRTSDGPHFSWLRPLPFDGPIEHLRHFHWGLSERIEERASEWLGKRVDRRPRYSEIPVVVGPTPPIEAFGNGRRALSAGLDIAACLLANMRYDRTSRADIGLMSRVRSEIAKSWPEQRIDAFLGSMPVNDERSIGTIGLRDRDAVDGEADSEAVSALEAVIARIDAGDRLKLALRIAAWRGAYEARDIAPPVVEEDLDALAL